MFDMLEISGKYWAIAEWYAQLSQLQPWQVDFTSSTEIPASSALAVLLWIVWDQPSPHATSRNVELLDITRVGGDWDDLGLDHQLYSRYH